MSKFFESRNAEARDLANGTDATSLQRATLDRHPSFDRAEIGDYCPNAFMAVRKASAHGD